MWLKYLYQFCFYYHLLEDVDMIYCIHVPNPSSHPCRAKLSHTNAWAIITSSGLPVISIMRSRDPDQRVPKH